jgi:hypothetical protein
MISFGSLDRVLDSVSPGIRTPAGPVSEAFIWGREPMMLLNGPIGSAKTSTEGKKVFVETTRMIPWFEESDGTKTREYNLSIWREKYDSLWNATIKSWFKIVPRDFGKFQGSPGRPANHTIEWEDEWSQKGYGRCRLNAMFRAFGESADPEEVRGTEYVDALLQEWDLLAEELTIAISGRLARSPVRSILGRPGRMYGSCNAPDVLGYIYRDFFETPPSGYRLYRQPGGLDDGAENIAAIGREYYLDIIAKNQHRPWYIKRMVNNRPGFTRDNDVVYPGYDDDRHLAPTRLDPVKSVRVIVGIDGGNTPAAVYMQEMPNRQLRILDEITTEASGMIALSRAMLRLEAERYDGCEFYTVCDPAMNAGHETEEGSDQQRLSKLLKRKVHFARTNDPERRIEPIAEALRANLDDGRPCFLLNRHCKALRRGCNQTYHWHRVRGTNERGRIAKTPDSHPHDAAGYGALETSYGLAARLEEEQRKRKAARDAKERGVERYNPLRRRG